MRNRKILFVFLILTTNTSNAQTDSSAYQKFLAGCVSDYQKETQAGFDNYFTLLNKCYTHNFQAKNPLFINALKEITSTKGLQEKAAVESLFKKTCMEVRSMYLWVGNRKMYEENNRSMEIFTNSLCTCLIQKILPSDGVERYLPAIKECTISMFKDTAFLNPWVRVSGRKVSEIARDYRYYSLYMYGHCKIIYDETDEALLNISALEQYYNEIQQRRSDESNRAFSLYQHKKFDSLKILFPEYLKYLPAFKKAANANLKKTVITREDYIRNIQNKPNPEFEIIFIQSGKEQRTLGQLIFKFSNDALNATMISAEYLPYKALNEGEVEIGTIQEIKKD